MGTLGVPACERQDAHVCLRFDKLVRSDFEHLNDVGMPKGRRAWIARSNPIRPTN